MRYGKLLKLAKRKLEFQEKIQHHRPTIYIL